MKSFIFTLSLFLCIFYTSTALKCLACSQQICKKPEGCRGGIVKDACNCCDTCAKISGEVCGGPWDILGKCGDQLQCVKNPKEGEDSFNVEGICKPICGPVCMIFCENGNVLNEKGCPTCGCYNLPKCIESSAEIYPVDTSVKAPLCPLYKCLANCEYGRVIDKNGCSTCTCRSLPALCDKKGCCNQPTKFCYKKQQMLHSQLNLL